MLLGEYWAEPKCSKDVHKNGTARARREDPQDGGQTSRRRRVRGRGRAAHDNKGQRRGSEEMAGIGQHDGFGRGGEDTPVEGGCHGEARG